jgi:pyruvate ferredoxin oxidoreductase delta subunit
MADITWKDVKDGALVDETGGARKNKTGDWRSQRPVYHKEKCTKCGMCYLYCPDAAIKRDAEGYVEFDFYYCKGCGICANECPVKAIEMVKESGKKE